MDVIPWSYSEHILSHDLVSDKILSNQILFTASSAGNLKEVDNFLVLQYLIDIICTNNFIK